MAPTAGSRAPDAAPDRLPRLGGWLFRHRSWLPVPIAVLLLLVPSSDRADWLPLAGLALVVAGEGVRLWAVRHIGVISRTRSDRLGRLVASGPFQYVRNPLYLGNMALWVGFALVARLPWLAACCLIVLAAQYHAIVCWEEGLLTSRLGEPYRQYVASVPRWWPRLATRAHQASAPLYSWGQTFFSERGTLIAIGVGCVLLAVKSGGR